MVQPPFPDMAVKAAFDAFAEPARTRLIALRALIYETAMQTPGVGRIEETLKWGQPAYLTPETRSGSTLRLGCPKSGGYAIFAHCQTTIIADFAATFGDAFRYDGRRAVLFRDDEAPDAAPLRLLIASALTYRLQRAA